MKTILNIKTDKKLKRDAQSIAKKIGVPLSTVVNSFLKQLVRDEEVVFSAKEYKITPYLESLVEEARREREKKPPVYFKSSRELIKGLNS